MRKSISRCTAAVAAVLVSSAASALDLSTAGFVTYGDTQSYALALLNEQAVGSNKSGDPFYVNSTPGAIQNLVVVATGSSGTGVTTNFVGMDNAYATPSGKNGSPFFSTNTSSINTPNPNGASIVGNLATTWDSSVSAMLSFLSGQSPIFFFNNNQINSGAASLQSLAAYAQAWITTPDGTTIYNPNGGTGVFDFTNRDSPYDVVPNGGGVPNGSVSAYSNVGGVKPPIAGDNTATDYVLSGGQLCVDSVGNFVPCSGSFFLKVNNNLGANQAAYALVVPELNAELAALAALASGGTDVSGYTLHLDIWLGCDPSIPAAQVATTCNGTPYGRSLNNGFEQIFIGTGNTVIQKAPEPGTLLLLGLGLAGIGFVAYRRKHANGRND
jgi:hypothetical protein